MRRLSLIIALCAAGAARAAMAGPIWPELSDAGPLPGSAQVVAGSGPLKGIQGQLTGSPLAGPGDFQDMYLIQIVDPHNFCAKTVIQPVDCCGKPFPINQQTTFNTQLWIFKADGTGILGNDDDPADPPRSRVGSAADDGSGAAITTPGLYYIAISGGPNDDPQSANGAIFNQTLVTEVSGPDGPGGANPVLAWAGGGPVGQYTILLCGAEFVDQTAIPTVSQWGQVALLALMVAIAAYLLRRRMREAAA